MRTSRTKQVLAAATAAAAIAALGLSPDASAVTNTPTSAGSTDTTAVDSRVGAITKPTQAQLQKCVTAYQTGGAKAVDQVIRGLLSALGLLGILGGGILGS